MSLNPKTQRFDFFRPGKITLLLVLLSLTGCAQVTQDESFSFGAWGLERLKTDLFGGTVEYRGGFSGEIFGGINRWSKGIDEETAQGRLDDISAQFTIVDSAAVAQSTPVSSPYTGVHFDIFGPTYLNTDFSVIGGTLRVKRVSGHHIWQASSVQGTDIEGDLSLVSRNGKVTLSILPLPNSTVLLDFKNSAVQITLPVGLPYLLDSVNDDAASVGVEDLGFDEVMETSGHFFGRTGDASIRLEVELTGGSIRVLRR